MRFLALAASLLVCASSAGAAEIKVLAPGLIGPGFAQVAAAFKAKTGHTAVLPIGTPTVGKIKDVIAQGSDADVVLLTPEELAGMQDKLKPGSEKTIGRVLFGLAVKTGAPHPDISTAEKFRAALKGKSVAYNDPAIGSLAGKMVDTLLQGPAYTGVKRVPYKGQGGRAVAAGDADMAVAVETEEVTNQGIDIVGEVPDAIGLKIVMSGAVLKNAPHAGEAASFLAFMTTPEAVAILKPTGIAP
ncbi:MAG TPA: substrate-binding domain-containing protein [Rhizomicrobium sp.]|nr:substrate-binding domain-containing protein [Rhizomicrobium sp.]